MRKAEAEVRRTRDMEVSLLVKSFFEAPVEAVLQRMAGAGGRRPSVRASLLGPRAATPGVAANSGPSIDVSSTAHWAASTGRVPGLGGVSSSPVHRAFVLVLGTNIAVLRTPCRD